jgi:hypothetical protein
MPTRTETLLFALLFLLLIVIEIACGSLAYFTLGELMISFYVLPISLNLFFGLLFFRRRRIAVVGLIILALLLIPIQVVLGIEVARVQAEAMRIVTYVYSYRDQTGHYPANLDEYNFQDPEVRSHFGVYQRDSAPPGFVLYYWAGSVTNSYWYSSHSGWGYYPD